MNNLAHNRSPKSQDNWSDLELRVIRLANKFDIPATELTSVLNRTLNSIKTKGSLSGYPLRTK